MNFKTCAKCKLELPLSVMQPIQARRADGQVVVVGVCKVCLKRIQREQEKNDK